MYPEVTLILLIASVPIVNINAYPSVVIVTTSMHSTSAVAVVYDVRAFKKRENNLLGGLVQIGQFQACRKFGAGACANSLVGSNAGKGSW